MEVEQAGEAIYFPSLLGQQLPGSPVWARGICRKRFPIHGQVGGVQIQHMSVAVNFSAYHQTRTKLCTSAGVRAQT